MPSTEVQFNVTVPGAASVRLAFIGIFAKISEVALAFASSRILP